MTPPTLLQDVPLLKSAFWLCATHFRVTAMQYNGTLKEVKDQDYIEKVKKKRKNWKKNLMTNLTLNLNSQHPCEKQKKTLDELR